MFYIGCGNAGQALVKDAPAYGKVEVKEARKGIAIYEVGETEIGLTPKGELQLDFHVGWLVRHPRNGRLYGSGGGRAHAFAVAADGQLSLASSADTMGNGAFLEVSRCGRWALVANYSNGVVCVLPILEDGSLGDATDSKLHGGVPLDPALADRQECCHPHQVRLDPAAEKWALVCDLGADRVWVYAFDSTVGALSGAANSSRHLRLPQGSGPRHLDFHPNGRWVYVLCELDGNLVVCDWSAEEGRLTVKQSLYALPEGMACCRAHHAGNSHVLVSADGRNVYVSTRTDNHIVVFRVDEGTGCVSRVQAVPSGGVCPRNFHLDYSGGRGVLRVGNQDSQSVTEFRIQSSDGTLIEPGTATPLPGVCPNVLPLPFSLTKSQKL